MKCCKSYKRIHVVQCSMFLPMAKITVAKQQNFFIA